MRTSTSLRLITADRRPVVERLWQLYQHDMSEFRGSMPDGEGAQAGPGQAGDTAGHLAAAHRLTDDCG